MCQLRMHTCTPWPSKPSWASRLPFLQQRQAPGLQRVEGMPDARLRQHCGCGERPHWGARTPTDPRAHIQEQGQGSAELRGGPISIKQRGETTVVLLASALGPSRPLRVTGRKGNQRPRAHQWSETGPTQEALFFQSAGESHTGSPATSVWALEKHPYPNAPSRKCTRILRFCGNHIRSSQLVCRSALYRPASPCLI